jgi:hypothetical protein
MARKFLTHLDLQTNQLQNAVIQPAGSDPTGIEGRIYYNSTSKKLKFYDGTDWQSLSIAGGSVTSVALSAPSIFTVSGSPVTTSGTLSLSLATQAANKVFAGPDTGVDAAPTFRSLVAADIPSITASKISDFTEAVQDITGGAVTAGTGISVVYDDAGAGTVTITNSDLGSSQNIFKNIAVSGQTDVVADSNNDTLTFAGSTGLTITTNATTDTVTFTNSGVTSVNGSTGAISNVALTTGTLAQFAATTSLQLKGVISDETGSGSLVFATSPALVTPDLGTPSAATLTNATGLPVSTGISGLGTGVATFLATPSSANLRSAVTDETGSGGALVFATSPTLTTPVIDSIVAAGTGSTATLWNNITTGTITIGSGLTSGSISIGASGTTTTIVGNLTVSGTTTTVNSETLTVNDNIIVLNNNVTGTPTENAGIEIERGTSTNASVTWNETTDKWTAGLTGSEAVILLSGVAASTDLTDFTEAAQDAVGGIVSGSNSLSVTYNDGTPSIVFDTTLATTSYLTKTSGLAIDISALESKLVTDGFTKKYAAQNTAITVSGGVATWTVTHSLGSKDVTVAVYEVASPYAEVEVDVEHTSTSAVTLKWISSSNVLADTYRVVVVG